MGDAFKFLVWDSLIKLAISELLKRVAFLSWGPVAFFITWLITKFSDVFYELFSDMIEIQVLILKNENIHKEFAEASLDLKRVAIARGVDSVEYKEVRSARIKKMENFVRYDRARAA